MTFPQLPQRDPVETTYQSMQRAPGAMQKAETIGPVPPESTPDWILRLLTGVPGRNAPVDTPPTGPADVVMAALPFAGRGEGVLNMLRRALFSNGDDIGVSAVRSAMSGGAAPRFSGRSIEPFLEQSAAAGQGTLDPEFLRQVEALSGRGGFTLPGKSLPSVDDEITQAIARRLGGWEPTQPMLPFNVEAAVAPNRKTFNRLMQDSGKTSLPIR